MTEEGLRILLSLVAPDGFPPHICAPSNNALGRASRSSGRPDVKVEDRFTSGLRFAGVIVDDVADLLFLAIDLS